MFNNILKIGIISRQDYIKRTIAIAKGVYKPTPDEPKVWFESILSLAQVLSAENREVLRIILDQQPASLKALANLTGRKSADLSKLLKRLERYGIVELRKENGALKPLVKATDFQVEVGLNCPFNFENMQQVA